MAQWRSGHHRSLGPKAGTRQRWSVPRISTSVPGLRISEHLPRLASQANDFAIIRSMSTREGDHSRARMVSATGYTPQGAIKFPSLGSLVAHEFDEPGFDIPAYVHVGGRPAVTSGGFLGPKFAPFVVEGGGRRGPMGMSESTELKIADLAPSSDLSIADQQQRVALWSNLRELSPMRRGSLVVDALDSAAERALQLMRPEAASAFNLDEEAVALRDAYGRTSFGQGCLLARRLLSAVCAV